MTDEEMANKYAKELCKTCTLDTCRYSTIQTCAIKEYLKQAFLAGLKAGRPKWHKVDDGDLPKNTNLVLVQTVNGNTTLGIYYANTWREICNCKELTGIYAWCEIPKYTEG